jgi:DNA-binding CsgD family transcriptional regulator
MGRTAKPQGIEPVWSDRQIQVLELLSAGRTNPEIATALGISLDGAKWHVREVLTKLGVESREEAASYWQTRSRFGGAHGNAKFARSLGWVSGIAAAGVVGVLSLAVAAGAFRDDEPPPPEQPEQGLVFAINNDGTDYILTVSSRDGDELARAPRPLAGMQTLGPHIILQKPESIATMLPDGSGLREIYSVTPGRTMVATYPSPDGQRLALLERIETGGGDALVLLEATSGQETARYEIDDPRFEGFLGGFTGVRWHEHDTGFTVSSGGVQVEGDHEFRQSVAHIGPDGAVRVSTFDASAAISPDGERALAGTPATPGCMGFVSSHALELLDLRTGAVLNRVTDPERGLDVLGWAAGDAGALFMSKPDASCGPGGDGTTFWMLPESGDAVSQSRDILDSVPAADAPLIEVSCGSYPRTRWDGGDSGSPQPIASSGGGCVGLGGPARMETPDASEQATIEANRHGFLYVQGRQIAELGDFQFVGFVDLQE